MHQHCAYSMHCNCMWWDIKVANELIKHLTLVHTSVPDNNSEMQQTKMTHSSLKHPKIDNSISCGRSKQQIMKPQLSCY